MATRHVFLETNWIVGCFAPAHFQIPAAAALLQEAIGGRLSIHVPTICLSEARSTIRRKFQPRNQADIIRSYLRWAKGQDAISASVSQTVREVLDEYESLVLRDLDGLEEALARFSGTPNVEIFALTERMLERSIRLSTERLELQPFDSSILAAVLTRALEIKMNEKDAEIFLCESDSDLQPWDKFGARKLPLAQLYDDARIWVYGDFLMTSPDRPVDWPI